MTNPTDQARCAAVLAGLNEELQWQLSSEQQDAMLSDVLAYVPPACSESKLRLIITAYHDDHSLVEALRDAKHPQHMHAWQLWQAHVSAILQHANLLWSSDAALDSADIIQIACSELAHALPGFRYASHFATWARQVVVRRIQRMVRDAQAHKRAVRPESLDVLLETGDVIDKAKPLAHHTETSLLIQQIEHFLAEQPDKRLQPIFRLWFIQDQRIDDIGKRIQVHPSRVRQLLNEIWHLLAHHEDIIAWLTSEEVDSPHSVQSSAPDSQKDA